MPIGPLKERVGVNAVEAIFLNDFKWIFREQQVSDFGIDAQVEVVESDQPTGRLIGLQIKAGSSYFVKRGGDFVFYGEHRHLEYWTRHSLPVFLILHNPETGLTLWQKIERHLVTETSKGWSIIVPAANILSAAQKSFFLLGPKDPSSIRRSNLALDYEVIQFVAAHERPDEIWLEVEDWVNKTLNIRGLKLFFDDFEKEEADIEFDFMAPTRGISDLMARYYPWLDFEHVQTTETMSSEVEVHILRVWLSEIGKSFIVVEEYFANGREPEEDVPVQDFEFPDDE